MAWASSPRSGPNHSAFCHRRTNCKIIKLSPQTAPTDDVSRISRLDAPDLGDLKNLKDENKELKEIEVGQSQILR